MASKDQRNSNVELCAALVDPDEEDGRNMWCPTIIDHLELKELRRERQYIRIVTHPLFDKPVLFKFAEFPWQIPYLEAETTAYEWIEGKDIGPRFLGHVTEAGRVFGFVLEHIEDPRHADQRDLKPCQDVLRRLHMLGVKHGDTNRFNFLLRGSNVTLVDFEAATRCGDEKEMEIEYRQLEDSLKDPSFRGGVGPVTATLPPGT
ncbi:hypothetical protein G7046_g597 [Stylonectria norvegica]|nr:hypothetical protein G7046_g597 [Stylonectria norvegica]